MTRRDLAPPTRGGLTPVALLLAGALTGAAFAQTSPAVPADRPVERTDPDSRLAHEQLLEKARSGRIDLYFMGDSITRRWGATDYPELLAHWRRTFHGWNAANFAWGGDTTQNILWRLEHGELDGLHPRGVVLLAGTNNLGRRVIPAVEEEATAADVARGVAAIVEAVRDRVPEATVILMAIFPRNDNPSARSTIEKINQRLARLADGRQVRFLDIHDRLSDAQGHLREEMTADGLHLVTPGYQVWADALRPLLLELLGPPAAEDHAPPPTGAN